MCMQIVTSQYHSEQFKNKANERAAKNKNSHEFLPCFCTRKKKKQKKDRNYTVVGSCESTLRHRDDTKLLILTNVRLYTVFITT